MAGDARLSHRARRRLRELKAIDQPPCWRCGGAIDYAAPAGHPLAYDLDELVAREHGGDPLDPGNVAPAHARCNRAAGGRSTAAKRRAGSAPAPESRLDPRPRPMTQW